MSTLGVFNFITLNGFYQGLKGDIGWHRHGDEEHAYAEKGSTSGSTLLFGRVTYDMMAGYWPTATAMKNDPVVAEGMNRANKIVFSRTLKTVHWTNTKLIKRNIIEEVRKMKELPGIGMTVLGSGSIVRQLADAGLVDEYTIMVDPVVLGRGAALFEGIKRPLNLKLVASRVFKSGVVLLTYEPMNS